MAKRDSCSQEISKVKLVCQDRKAEDRSSDLQKVVAVSMCLDEARQSDIEMTGGELSAHLLQPH